MPVTSRTHRLLTLADFREWAWWQLPAPARAYLGLGVLAWLGATGYAASQTHWLVMQVPVFAILLACSVISVVAKQGPAYRLTGLHHDFLSSWVLPVAIALPPVFALVTPVPLQFVYQMRVNRGTPYRVAFTAAVMGLSYGTASLLFRLFPSSFAGTPIRTGVHALTWTIAVVCCELVGGRGHHLLIALAVKLSGSPVRLLHHMRETMYGDVAESDLGILIAVVAGITPLLEIFAIPTVLLIRRYMMHEHLLAQAQTDTKTGLLNSSTWENQARTEVTRAVRTGSSLSVLLIDIDHFKAVNDTHGHLAGDAALRAVSGAVREHLRSYDLAGRFGGEEFVVLLPNAGQQDAFHIAERLRKHIAALRIPAAATAGQDGTAAVGDGQVITMTVSIGVSSLTDPTQELADLMAAADAAMYHAKQAGRNKTCTVVTSGPVTFDAPATPAAGAAIPHHASGLTG